MKISIYILIALFPLLCYAQHEPSSPALNAWQNLGSPKFTTGEALYPSLEFSPSGELYLAFFDGANSGKTSVRKFDGTSWINVGNPGFSAGVAQWQSLKFNPVDGSPYVAFRDDANASKTTVMKFDGSAWVNVGAAGFSAGISGWQSLAFSPAGEPYVAFCDYSHSLKASVMKFNGNSWVYIGNAGFSPGEGTFESLVFSPSGQPFVAFADHSAVPWLSASVMKYDGSNWVYVGNQGFSNGYSSGESMAFSPSGEPYVAYIDWADSSKTSVMKYNGTSWVYVGTRGCSKSAGWIDSEGLAFSPTNGQPYIAFEDTAVGMKASVMTFNGTDWIYVGDEGFTAEYTEEFSLAFSSSGQPFVAFAESYNRQASVMKYEPCTIPPVPVITGPSEVCVNSGYIYYSTESGMTGYQWNISAGGTINTGQGANTIQVIWNQPGSQWVSVTYTNTNGCLPVNPTQFPVLVDPFPNPAGPVSGLEVVCAGSDDILYSISPVSNAFTYLWSLPPQATITSGAGTNAIVVKFDDNSISGNFKVYANNICGNGDASPPLFVTINPIPPVPTISANGDTLISSAPVGNQWFYNDILMVNDTSQFYTVNQSSPGYYWTQVTLSGCISDTSNHFYYSTTGFKNDFQAGLSLCPNPVTNELYIDITNSQDKLKVVEIYGMEGDKRYEAQTNKDKIIVNVEHYPPAVYFLRVTIDGSTRIARFCKN